MVGAPTTTTASGGVLAIVVVVVSVVVVFSEWARNHQQLIRNTHGGGKLKANTVGTAKATHCIIELCGERSGAFLFCCGVN